jgi:hypothetical protein
MTDHVLLSNTMLHMEPGWRRCGQTEGEASADTAPTAVLGYEYGFAGATAKFLTGWAKK